jgi:NAD(P)-dependent dehydrogenase (short-subunit alcohol dehydrogenase family)
VKDVPQLRFAAPVEPRVAVVTGGAKGMGRACALRLAEAGRAIAVVDLNEALARETVDAVVASGGTARAFLCNVADPEAVERTVTRIKDDFGRLDILVNAAGIIGKDLPLLETPIQMWRDVLDVNLSGTYYMSRAVVPHMLERQWGRIVNFTSGAREGIPTLVPYAVSKAGIVPITRAFAAAFTGQGILVNAIEPGRVLTDMVVTRVPEEVVRRPGNPIGRYADPEELAEVIAFLCSEANTYASGGIVPVKGGTR